MIALLCASLISAENMPLIDPWFPAPQVYLIQNTIMAAKKTEQAWFELRKASLANKAAKEAALHSKHVSPASLKPPTPTFDPACLPSPSLTGEGALADGLCAPSNQHAPAFTSPL